MVGLLRDDFWEEVDVVWGLQRGFGAVFLGGGSGRSNGVQQESYLEPFKGT